MENDQIRVWIDNGTCSVNEHYVDYATLETTQKEWEAMDEEEQLKLITEYWNSYGYPEIGWDKYGV